jgi:S-adenosylmethionine decarboxylase
MIKEQGPDNYILNPEDKNHPLINEKMELLRKEMIEVYHMIH